MKPMISLIVAMSKNQMIGRDNQLPWHLPNDLKHFKQVTMGKPMIMGRKTWESLPGLLPHRQHIVMTRDSRYVAKGCDVVLDLEQALRLVQGQKEVMIVGGGQMYRQFLAQAQHLYITRVDTVQEGDTFFPEILQNEWHLLSKDCFEADEKHAFAFCFEHYGRKEG